MLRLCIEKVKQIIKGTSNPLVYCEIYPKSTTDVFLHKYLAFLTKYFLNINVGFGKDLA